MSLPTSDTVSTFSTIGSASQYADARSQFTDARSAFEDAESNMVNENDNLDKLTQTEPGSDDTGTSNEKVGNDENDNTIKTTQPEAVKQPKVYVSKADKIKQIQTEKQKRTESHSQQKKEGECHEYLCSNHILEVLDLPDWKSLFCGLCTVCCNSCVSSGTAQAKISAGK